MSDYFIRIELFNADSEQYEALHEKMKSMGFERTIAYNDGVLHQLPIGTYCGVTALDEGSLREKLSKIADPLSRYKAAAVIVIKSIGWAGYLYPA